MLFEIRHVTEYHYAGPVRESVMELWLQPNKSGRQRLISFDLDLEPAAKLFSYVDAFGTDEDVITLSLPCEQADRFVGVCSLDLRADELGVRVTRALRELGRRAALVNAEGRVVASTVVAHLPGSLLRDLKPGRRRGERTGWSVLALY